MMGVTYPEVIFPNNSIISNLFYYKILLMENKWKYGNSSYLKCELNEFGHTRRKDKKKMILPPVPIKLFSKYAERQ